MPSAGAVSYTHLHINPVPFSVRTVVCPVDVLDRYDIVGVLGPILNTEHEIVDAVSRDRLIVAEGNLIEYVGCKIMIDVEPYGAVIIIVEPVSYTHLRIHGITFHTVITGMNQNNIIDSVFFVSAAAEKPQQQ